MRNAQLIAILMVLLLVGCSALKTSDSAFRDRKYDYRKAQSLERMTVPDGYDSETIVDFYPVPPASPHADTELIFDPPLPRGILVDTEHKVKVQRLGDREWILVQLSPSEVWPRLKSFMQQQGFQILVEQGENGFLLVSHAPAFYHFRLQQGFQHNHSEIAVRQASDLASAQQWQKNSNHTEQESQLLFALANFLSQIDTPIYSYAAHNISVEKRLITEYDNQGLRYLLVKADKERVRASLQLALKKADFSELDGSDENQLIVQYTPQSEKTRKKAWWQKLFFVKLPAYDKAMPYAGRKYRFYWQTQGVYEKVQIDSIEPVKKETPEQILKELNLQIQAVRGLLS